MSGESSTLASGGRGSLRKWATIAVVMTLVLVVAAMELTYRNAYKNWAPWRLPNHLEFHDRNYYPGGDVTRTQVAKEEGKAPRFTKVSAMHLLPFGGVQTRAILSSTATPQITPTALYIRVAADRYAEYDLSGGF